MRQLQSIGTGPKGMLQGSPLDLRFRRNPFGTNVPPTLIANRGSDLCRRDFLTPTTGDCLWQNLSYLMRTNAHYVALQLLTKFTFFVVVPTCSEKRVYQTNFWRLPTQA